MFLSNNKNIERNMSFDGKTINSSDTVELFRITRDKNNNFQRHLQNICHKTNNKTKALFCIRKFLNFEQAQVLVEASVSLKFLYCPLIWMFCGKMSVNFIVKTHYQCRNQSIFGDTVYLGAEGTKIFDFDNPGSLEKALSGTESHRKLLLLTEKY